MIGIGIFSAIVWAFPFFAIMRKILYEAFKLFSVSELASYLKKKIFISISEFLLVSSNSQCVCFYHQSEPFQGSPSSLQVSTYHYWKSFHTRHNCMVSLVNEVKNPYCKYSWEYCRHFFFTEKRTQFSTRQNNQLMHHTYRSWKFTELLDRGSQCVATKTDLGNTATAVAKPTQEPNYTSITSLSSFIWKCVASKYVVR